METLLIQSADAKLPAVQTQFLGIIQTEIDRLNAAKKGTSGFHGVMAVVANVQANIGDGMADVRKNVQLALTKLEVYVALLAQTCSGMECKKFVNAKMDNLQMLLPAAAKL